MQPPQTQYVERDGISIAYLLLSPGFVSHLDLCWADQGYQSPTGSIPPTSRNTGSVGSVKLTRKPGKPQVHQRPPTGITSVAVD